MIQDPFGEIQLAVVLEHAVVGGVEAMVTGEFLAPNVSELSFPYLASYTLNHSRFSQSFDSENPQWGEVEKGDELPYLARHTLGVEAGVRKGNYELSAAVRYLSAMRDQAGQGAIAADERVDASTVIDLSAHAEIAPWGHVYGTFDNVLGTRYAVSRRPFGLRPGKPRLFIVGYKNHW